MAIEQDLIEAVEVALAGDWEAAHAIVQRHEGERRADWVHAVLHRIEGDHANSRYWYGQASRAADAFGTADEELRAIRAHLAGA
jgi:hypothetical protein